MQLQKELDHLRQALQCNGYPENIINIIITSKPPPRDKNDRETETLVYRPLYTLGYYNLFQMRQLTLDREQMKVKVDRLNELVKALLLEKGGVPPDMLDKHLVDKEQLCAEHAKNHEEISLPINQNGLNNNSRTAEKIIELLSDIKTSNLVQPSEMSETFHPCPWCSGQLITV
ncbi:putative golgin subfamily A member 2-like protein 5 [Trypoxylus dichotomus]